MSAANRKRYKTMKNIFYKNLNQISPVAFLFESSRVKSILWQLSLLECNHCGKNPLFSQYADENPEKSGLSTVSKAACTKWEKWPLDKTRMWFNNACPTFEPMISINFIRRRRLSSCKPEKVGIAY